jgi:hypothetical protein
LQRVALSRDRGNSLPHPLLGSGIALGRYNFDLSTW